MPHAPADLVSPAVVFQYLTMQLAIALRTDIDTSALGRDALLYEAFRLTSGEEGLCFD